jgi:low affinity Fe/Cu permease
MKLNEPLKEKKLPFFSWILFNPTAFKVIYLMSMIVGMLISGLFTFLTWYYSWNLEVSIIITIFAVFNVYSSVKHLRTIRYSDTTINEMVYSGKYKPKKVKRIILTKDGHDKSWPTKGGKKWQE